MRRALAAVLLVIVSACGHSTTTPRASGPLDGVGPGWVLAMWDSRTDVGEPPATSTLFLVDPGGKRRELTTLRGGRLEDWSPDGRRAVVALYIDEEWAEFEVDLTTGTRRPVPGDHGAKFAPDGKGIWITSGHAETTVVDGAVSAPLTIATPKSLRSRPPLYWTSHDRYVVGSTDGLRVVTRTDETSSSVAVPHGKSTYACEPVRWWSRDVVLVGCPTDDDHGDPSERLWMVPLVGGAPTQLTITAGRDQYTIFDYDDFDAWAAGGTTFVSFSPGCGTYLGRVRPDKTVEPFTVPGTTPDSTTIVGVHDDQLYVTAAGCDGSEAALIRYDPRTNTRTDLLGPGVNGGEVGGAVLFHETPN